MFIHSVIPFVDTKIERYKERKYNFFQALLDKFMFVSIICKNYTERLRGEGL